MNKIVDPWANSGELLHAMLEGWVVAEISDLNLSLNPPKPPIESRRERGIQRVRRRGTSVSQRFRPPS